MDHLRQGIGLRGYAQKNPKQEYKRESFELFQQLLDNLKFEVTRFLCHVQIQRRDEAELLERKRREAAEKGVARFQHAEASALADARAGRQPAVAQRRPLPRLRTTLRAEQPKVGRNEPCPCGSARSTSSAVAGSDGAAEVYRGFASGQPLPVSRRPGRLDRVECSSSPRAPAWPATFTRNAFCAAPVLDLAEATCRREMPRYLLINTGNANAATGNSGLADDAGLLCRAGAKSPGWKRDRFCRSRRCDW